MKVESSDNGFNYLVSELNLDQDSYYQININKEGYVFTIPEIYVPIPYEPIPVTFKVHQTGRMNELIFEFNYNIPNLQPAEVTFTPAVEISSIQTSDNGITYMVKAIFKRNTLYNITVKKYGYTFTTNVSFTSYASWDKKDWRIIVNSLGLEYDEYRNYPIFCELFVQKYFIVALGEKDEIPKHWIWTQDFEKWEIFQMPRGTSATYGETLMMGFNYWSVYSHYLYILIGDYIQIENPERPWRLFTSDSEIYRLDLNDVSYGWELIVGTSDWSDTPINSNADKRSIGPTAIGVSSSYIWCLGDRGYTNSNTYENAIRITATSGSISYLINNLSSDEARKYSPVLGTTAGTQIRLFLCNNSTTTTLTTSYAQKGISSTSSDVDIATGLWNPTVWKKRKTSVIYDNGKNQYAAYPSYYDATQWIRENESDYSITKIPTPFVQSTNRVISRPSNGRLESANTYKWTYWNKNEYPQGIRDYTVYSFIRYLGGFQAWEQQIFDSNEGYTDAMAEIVGINDSYFIMHFVNLDIEYPWFYMSPKDYSFDKSNYTRVVYGSELVEGKWD